jgi:hypothetical protein
VPYIKSGFTNIKNTIDMSYVLRKLIEIKAFFILRVVCRLLYKYVDRQRMWYEPTNKFVRGDKVKLNWKYIVVFDIDVHYTPEVWTFDKIDDDNVVDTIEGETYNLYWLCAG